MNAPNKRPLSAEDAAGAEGAQSTSDGRDSPPAGEHVAVVTFPNVHWALAYAEAGFAVVPVWHIDADTGQCACPKGEACDRPGKHPLSKHGVKDATADAGLIRDWWSERPEANVAVATGELSGCIVIDVDTADGKAGDVALTEAVATKGGVPRTLRARSASGGAHYFYRWRPTKFTRKIGFLRHVDYLADGGYCIVQPSTRGEGKAYAWVTVECETWKDVAKLRDEMSELPEWFDALQGAGRAGAKTAKTAKKKGADRRLTVDLASAMLPFIDPREHQVWQDVTIAAGRASGQNEEVFELLKRWAQGALADESHREEWSAEAHRLYHKGDAAARMRGMFFELSAQEPAAGAPPLTYATLHALAVAGGWVPSGDDDGEGNGPGRPPLSRVLLNFALERFALIRDHDNKLFAQQGDTGEVFRLGSKMFKERVSALIYAATEGRIIVSDKPWKEALGTLEGRARFHGDEHRVWLRVGVHEDGRYFLDLCQHGNTKAVEVGPQGWRVVDRPDVLFVRNDNMHPLPDPLRDGDFDQLWRFANVPEDRRLIVTVFMIDCLRPDTPFAGLEIHGGYGTGKSETAKALRRVIDPNAAPLRSAPRDSDDIIVAGVHNHVICYENLSRLSDEAQDRLCMLSTGGGQGKRALYTDDDEHVVNLKRPWIVNGINPVLTRQDAVSRAISFECPPLLQFRPTDEVEREFTNALPGILGGVLNHMEMALRALQTLDPGDDDQDRMVAFRRLGLALTDALGLPRAAFNDQYHVQRKAALVQALEDSAVAGALLQLIDKSGIEAVANYTMTNLLQRLREFRPEGVANWPKTAKGLGNVLRMLLPSLERIHGITFEVVDNGRHMLWTARRVPPQENGELPEGLRYAARRKAQGANAEAPEEDEF